MSTTTEHQHEWGEWRQSPLTGFAYRDCVVCGEPKPRVIIHACDWPDCGEAREAGFVFCAEHNYAEIERWLEVDEIDNAEDFLRMGL